MVGRHREDGGGDRTRNSYVSKEGLCRSSQAATASVPGRSPRATASGAWASTVGAIS